MFDRTSEWRQSVYWDFPALPLPLLFPLFSIDDGNFDLYSQLRPKTNYALAAAYKTLKMMMRESSSSTVQISRINQLVKQGKKCGHERVSSFFSPGPEPRGNESHFCRIFLLFLLFERFPHRQLVCLTRRHPEFLMICFVCLWLARSHWHWQY